MFFFAQNLYWGKEKILAQSCSLNQCASNDIHYDIKNWDLTLSQGQLFTWIGSTMYQSMCLWYRHSDIQFVFALHFDRKLLRKTFAELRWAPDDLTRDQWENIEPWSLRRAQLSLYLLKKTDPTSIMEMKNILVVVEKTCILCPLNNCAHHYFR